MIEMTNETWHPTEAVLNEYLDGELSPTEKVRVVQGKITGAWARV
jgi:anti-sigma factor RsiW